MKQTALAMFLILTVPAQMPATGQDKVSPTIVTVSNGVLEGFKSADGKIRIFKGIPYAAPPVGPLRWKTPQPASPWTGVLKATEFGSHPVQGRVFTELPDFNDKGPSEDCLTLNIWTPTGASSNPLPVMVWIHGGGFQAGGSSMSGLDGEGLARKGVVLITFNYRLGAFGFLAHPELSKESGHGTSGNYGLMDQIAVLTWVKLNIAAFGGDPKCVTIFGESAGAMAVAELMASPLAKGLFHRAIGESGTIFTTSTDTDLDWITPTQTEAQGVKFAAAAGARSLAELRAKSAEAILEAAMKPKTIWFGPTIDGYVLPGNARSDWASFIAIYSAGKQSHVPLLVGWNADEIEYGDVLEKAEPTAQNYVARMRKLYGDHAEGLLKLYPVGDDAQTRRTIVDLATDQFVGVGSWKWVEFHATTGAAPVFRYLFEEKLPAPTDKKGAVSPGAIHTAEIEFVFQTLPSKNLPWRPEAFKLSDLMSSYWVNFAKTGDPNGPGLPRWPAYERKGGYQVMHLNATPFAARDEHRARYEFLDTLPPPKH